MAGAGARADGGRWAARAPLACGASAAGAALLLAYAAAIAINLQRGRRDLACGCGGPHERRPIAAWMVWGNLLLAGLLGAVLLPWMRGRWRGGCDHHRGGDRGRRTLIYESRPVLAQITARTACARLMMTALAVSNVVLGIWAGAVGRGTGVGAATGVLHERMRRPARSCSTAPGGRWSRRQSGSGRSEGHAHRVGAARTNGRSTLLFVRLSHLPVCKSLLPAVKSSRKDERTWMDVILASDGDTLEQRQFVGSQGLDGIRTWCRRPWAGLPGRPLPFAALLDEQGSCAARGLSTRASISRSVRAKRLGVASLQEYFSVHCDDPASLDQAGARAIGSGYGRRRYELVLLALGNGLEVQPLPVSAISTRLLCLPCCGSAASGSRRSRRCWRRACHRTAAGRFPES